MRYIQRAAVNVYMNSQTANVSLWIPAARAAANEMPPLPDGEAEGLTLLLVSLAREVGGVDTAVDLMRARRSSLRPRTDSSSLRCAWRWSGNIYIEREYMHACM
jgi:hypothetical protein